MPEKKARSVMALILVIVLLSFGVTRAVQGNGFMWDALASLIALLAFWKIYEQTHQDLLTFSFVFAWMVMHNLGFYDQVFLVGYDKWMHLMGGVTGALIADRWFRPEKLPLWQHLTMIILLPLGLGALHEIVEWVGFRQAGHGQGFLFYGEGDFGEWQNAILDMASNLIGTLLVTGYVVSRKLK